VEFVLFHAALEPAKLPMRSQWPWSNLDHLDRHATCVITSEEHSR